MSIWGIGGALLALLLAGGNAFANNACETPDTVAARIEQLKPWQKEKRDRMVTALNSVAAVHAKLVASSDLKPPLLVCLSAVPNAWVFEPGKPIHVSTGLLERYGHDEDFLAGVLAHELGHLVRNHAGYRKNAQRSLASSAEAAARAEYYRTGSYNKAIATGTKAFYSQAAAFSREQEADADSYAAVLLARAGLKPDTIMKVMERFLADQGDRPAQWLSSHPGWGERLNRVEPRVRDEEIDQLARQMTSAGDRAALAKQINQWLAQLPESGNAWFHKAEFLQRLGAPGYVEAYERALVSQGPAISRSEAELPALWVSLCVGLYRTGYKLESAHCSRYIKDDESRAQYRAQTFGDNLFMHGVQADGTLLTARDRDGTKIITNDPVVLRTRGLPVPQAVTPWRPIRFPPTELEKPLRER